MGFELIGHTADIAVAAKGDTLDTAFAAIADGMAAAQCGEVPSGGDRFSVSVDAGSIEALLFDYLDELIYQRDVRNVLPVDNEVDIESDDGGYHLMGTARGVALEQISAREVKAVTYSEMEVEKQEDGWRVYVVLDV